MPVEKSQAYEYGTISFTDYLRYYWTKRYIFYRSIIILLALGLFFALASPVEYTTETSITPEYELQDQVNEIIESYGLLFGLTGNIRRYRSHSYLLDQYPEIVNSTSFQYTLIQQPFVYEKKDTAITIYDYFTRFYQPSLTQIIYKYTLGLPSTLRTISEPGQSSPPVFPEADSVLNVSSVSDAQFPVVDLDPRIRNVINELSSRIAASFDRQTGIVRIQTKMPEPRLTAILAQLTLEVLDKKARKYKTDKSLLYLEYLQGQLKQARTDLEEARQALIQAGDTENQLISERLEQQSNYEAYLDRYNSIIEQINRIQKDLANQNPVFRVLEDITIPEQKSEPDRMLIITLSLLLGIFLAVCWVTFMFFISRLESS